MVEQRHVGRLGSAARWMLLSVLITNVGNGMHTLAVAQLLYGATGSAEAFGTVIVAEFVIGFLVTMLAGSVVDSANPKTVCLRSDAISGTTLLAATALLMTFASTVPVVYGSILVSILVINVVRPFYSSATFSLGPEIARGDLLIRYNAYSRSFMQVGQLAGVGLAGPVIHYLGTGVAFGLNGLSYVLAGAAIWFAKVPRMDRSDRQAVHILDVRAVARDWKELARVLRSDPPLVCLAVLCAGDYLAVALINLSLVPLVDQRLGGNTLWLSVLDGSFAVGALAAASVAARLANYLGNRTAAFVGMAGQAACFLLLALEQHPYPLVLAMFCMGATNAFSLTVLMSGLQRRSRASFRGRVSAVRGLAAALLSVILIPLVANLQSTSLTQGLWASSVICAIFGVTAFALTRKRLFGTSLLEDR